MLSEPSTSHSVIYAHKGKSFPSSLNTTLYWPGVKTVIFIGKGGDAECSYLNAVA